MTQSTSYIAPTSKFSLRRTVKVAKYYWPSLKKQVLIYSCLSLGAGVAGFLLEGIPFATLFMVLLATAMTFMAYWAAAAFTSHSSLEIETSLPAKISERALFILAYTLIAVPILLFGPKLLSSWLLGICFDPAQNQQIAGDLSHRFATTFGWLDTLEMYVPIVTCLFAVFAYNKSRFTMGAVWSIVSIIGLGISGVVMGLFVVFRSTGSDLESFAGKLKTGDAAPFLSLLDNYAYWMIALYSLYILLMIVLFVRALNRKQL